MEPGRATKEVRQAGKTYCWTVKARSLSYFLKNVWFFNPGLLPLQLSAGAQGGRRSSEASLKLGTLKTSCASKNPLQRLDP